MNGVVLPPRTRGCYGWKVREEWAGDVESGLS